MDQHVSAEWIAVDWGTSHLRAWAMKDAAILAEARSEDGMSRMSGGDFEAALLRLIGPWLGAATPVEVIACGMVGARQGWVEAPYTAVPARPLSVPPVPAPCGDPRLRAFVIAGLKQVAPPDVMRGEETQIAGFLALNHGWDGVICLPGTHSKWARVSAGEVVSFQTCMTGEIFELLGTRSVLRFSVADQGWDGAAFREALDDTISRPDQLASRLFGLRARDLLDSQDRMVARSRLSGLLIGAELAATRPYWLGQQLAVIGSRDISGTYADALAAQGAPAILADGTAMTVAGLAAAHAMLETVQ